MDSRSHVIGPLGPRDETILRETLYHAIHVPAGSAPPLRDIVDQPELSRYVADWGRPDDIGFAATDVRTGQILGAAWLRLLAGEQRGYGYIDDATPELGVAVIPTHRGRGIGTELLNVLLREAALFHRCVSLSVAEENPAVRLYQRLGFQIVGRCGTSLTMKKVLNTTLSA